jgi:hypothetical protein
MTMRLNTDPDEPPGKPNIYDYAELVNVHLPPATIIKALPFNELERRCEEIIVERPYLREEVPLVLKGEKARRQRLQGLRVVRLPQSNPQVA